MRSTITITPLNNISNGSVIDNNKITMETHNSDMMTFTVENEKTNDIRRCNLMGVSLYDDVLIINDVKYKILRMLTRN